MYPIQLEKALEDLWKVEFSRYTKNLSKELFRILELGGLNSGQDSHFFVRSDGNLPHEVVEFFAKKREARFRGQSVPGLGPTGSRKILAQLAGWANSQVQIQMERQSQAMGMPKEGISSRMAFPESQKKGFRVPAINLPPSALSQYIDDHGKYLDRLQKTLFQDHENSLQNVVIQNLRKGERLSTLKESIAKQMDVDSSRAAFWARDQAGKFYGSVNREAQIRAGFTGYIWRTMRDVRVRDTHKDLEGKYFDWKNPPLVGSQHYHPGEDYNCRCWAEPARDPGFSRDPIRVLGGPDPQAQGLQRNLQGGAGENPADLSQVFGTDPPREFSGKLILPAQGIKSRELKKLKDDLLSKSKKERLQLVENLKSAKWEEANLSGHIFREREMQFNSLFGKSIVATVSYFLANKKFDKVYFGEKNGATITFVHQGKRLVVPISMGSLKIKTAFILDESEDLSYYFRNAIELD